ncbi:DUF3667 domain-containing protein [Dawidia soli]|uniref:DUF3667 domain-containing protein n=1 Tax=Dawidia soli TaxID=2782352 RepID=A0AAP2D9G8_9BACT|nr:DUF3667 domain-containing protein [Dawidia soli]MBT1686800.1 DUF3667 domain-containing protein [Dawidia soli]
MKNTADRSFVSQRPGTCASCKTSVVDKFCGHCGRPAQINRVDWHYIMHEIQHVLHFDKGILYTVRELLRRPGTSIQEFITVDRARLVKPILFIVLTSLIYTVIDHLFHIEQGYIDYHGAEGSAVVSIMRWSQRHYGYANIIMGAFIAFWLMLIFRRHDYNFFEILILLCFVMGMGMLMFAVFAAFEGLTGLHAMQLSAMVTVSYAAWAIGQFFDKRGMSRYFKALAAYLLGMVTFAALLIMAGLFVDFLKK